MGTDGTVVFYFPGQEIGSVAGPQNASAPQHEQRERAMKVILWIVGIIFLVGLLVIFGVIDLIF